jgi:hypothetical protein
MSFVCCNLILVTGPRQAVTEFRNDARRRLSPSDKKEARLSRIDLSLSRLYRKHGLAAPSKPWRSRGRSVFEIRYISAKSDGVARIYSPYIFVAGQELRDPRVFHSPIPLLW